MSNSASNIKCSTCGEEGHRCTSKKCRLYDQNKSNLAGKSKCSACGEEGHRRTSKKCRLYEQNKSNSAGKSKCSACGEEGHRRTSKKCRLYEHNKSNYNSAGKRKNPIWKDSDARRELKSIFLDDKDGTYLVMPAEEL